MKKYRKNVQVLLPLLIFFVLFMHPSVHASNTHVFRIKSGDTVQTGFTVQGKSGIITALHGVVGRQSIDAQDTQGGSSFKKLKITSVDIEHDLAFLYSSELDKKKDGLKIPPIGRQPDYTKIHSIGYPYALTKQVPLYQLGIHPPYLEQLFVLLPNIFNNSNLREIIQNRKSPNSEKKVLRIEGQLLPGYSGAPILNANEEVIGVANGGLGGGTIPISWAIPYNQIIWKPASSKTQELERLAKLKTSALFSFNVFQTSNGALLEWQKPRAGKMMTWEEANDYVAEKNEDGLMGYYDWRLPAIGELQELAKFVKNSPGSYSDTNKLYWSSEKLGSLEAKVVNLGNAKMEWYDIDQQVASRSKDNKFSVRLVRSLIQ